MTAFAYLFIYLFPKALIVFFDLRSINQQVLRGHSGIFIDRSTFHIKDSSVSHNHLTGISLVGDGSHAIIEDTQILGNATLPIDASEDRIELRGENEITEGNEN